MFAPRMSKATGRASPMPLHTRPQPARAPAAIGNQARLRLHVQPGVRRVPADVYARLEIGDVNDPLEREADRVAEQVMRKPDAHATITSGSVRVSAKCSACQDEERSVQPKQSGTQAAEAAPPSQFGQSVRSGGQPLARDVRGDMEQQFGRDFSRVRIHTSVQSTDEPARIGALAYTVGNHIVFAPNLYNPASFAGRHLLAHELTHVAQQGAAAEIAPSNRMAGQDHPVPLTSASSQRPQFGIYSAVKCSYYTWKMGDIFKECREEYNRYCSDDMTSDRCLKYMDYRGAGNPSDAIYNCARKREPDTFKSWLESCAKTATGSYGNSKYTSNDPGGADPAAGGGPADTGTQPPAATPAATA